MQGHILEEWRIRDIEQKADQAVRRLYEIDSLRSELGHLECANREFRAEADGLRCRVETLEGQIADLFQRIETPAN